MIYRNVFVTSVAFGLSACATMGDDATFRGTDTMDMESAVLTPINDIGLDDIDIPEYLSLMIDPYGATPTTCESLQTEVADINALLGDDLDVPDDAGERREQTALNATSSTIGSVLIPFRGVVRAISGAASNERDAQEAYERGLVRRAYLKGIASQTQCDL